MNNPSVVFTHISYSELPLTDSPKFVSVILFLNHTNRQWVFTRDEFFLLHYLMLGLITLSNQLNLELNVLYMLMIISAFVTDTKNMHTIERQLQQVLNNLQKWSNGNGFKFSISKTKCMHFVNFVNIT